MKYNIWMAKFYFQSSQYMVNTYQYNVCFLDLDLEMVYCSHHCDIVALQNEHKQLIK